MATISIFKQRAASLSGWFHRRIQKPSQWAFSLLLSISLVTSGMGGSGGTAITGKPVAPFTLPNGDPTGSGTTMYLPYVSAQSTGTGGKGWPTVGANPERTSWVPEEVSGPVHPIWYRPIEAYIPQNVQVIASDGLLFIATARGLYALKAQDGSIAWRYDTRMPLGNSPTVADHVVYVGGYDRKIHALDEMTGLPLWSFDGAGAGYSTNPLVVDGKVIAGNRDGFMYAIGAQGTSSAGRLLWKYQTGGPIDISAAYKNGVVYFAAMDNNAYALNANTGALVWKSKEKMPGDGFLSYWAVIFQDKVVFSGSSPYRTHANPGTKGILDASGSPYSSYDAMQRDDIFYDRDKLGPVITDTGAWAHGRPVIDATRASEYLEANPAPDPHLHKPWRRSVMVLNQVDGSEYTTDVNHNNYPEYAPFLWYGTRSGNAYPPIVGTDNVLYRSNPYLSGDIPQGMVMGWKIGTSHMSIIGLQGADDEPQALSGGGNLIYRSICCDRVGDWVNINTGDTSAAWGYTPFDLSHQIPGYDVMWWGIDPGGLPRLVGNYGTKNGVYHNHGDQNPIIPYNGMLFSHHSNAVIAFGKGTGSGKLPLLTIQSANDTPRPVSLDVLKARLNNEIQKMVNAGHLRPGYYNNGQWGFTDSEHLPDYFANPADTLLTLTRAYPYLPPALQQQVKTYLQNEFKNYFDPTVYSQMGWSEGAAREWMPMPPEVQASIKKLPKQEQAGSNWSWLYPPIDIYALWKYASLSPADTGKLYTIAKKILQVPCPADAAYLQKWPYEFNAWIAGYYGFLQLQGLAGMNTQDAALRQSVTNELNRLEQLRASTFTKDTPWLNPNDPNKPIDGGDYHNRALNVAQNFIYLTPELGSYLNKNALSKVQAAVDEYNSVAPYWFVSRYTAVVDEGVMQQLYDYNAMFQAKAYILKQPREELTKYLDVSAFAVGDLLYIQNLIAAIEAP